MTTEIKEITSSDDVIDVRDVIARVEELNETMADQDERDEYEKLVALLKDLEGNGGDEEWRGSWYPVTLIRESYFEDYARELAEDISATKRDLAWPNNHIDWEAAADELLIDYKSTEFEGITYYYR